jgi:predicted adenine nucleotide alpha hydrolase (AANH) superfamily ATPase
MLHICCAPDATVPLAELAQSAASGRRLAGYFYGSNIHPREEYLRRAEAVALLARRMGVTVAMRPYSPDEWLARAAPLADEHEGGKRCELCFTVQLEAAAVEGVRCGADALCSSLSTSPHKDVKMLSRVGEQVSREHGIAWDGRVWRKNGGFVRSVALSRDLGLYRQNYCGCVYSIPKSR